MRERGNGIGELNESSLHARLKELYLAEGGASEVPIGRWVADVVLADGRIVEIQTGAAGQHPGQARRPAGASGRCAWPSPSPPRSCWWSTTRRGARCSTGAAPPSGARC